MSLETPTLKQISDNIIAQMQSTLNQNIPLLPKSFIRVLAKALAGTFILIYKYAGFNFLQMFVRTASNDQTEILGNKVTPLLEWGRLKGIPDPSPATTAELTISIEVITQIGSLPAGTLLRGVKNGVLYSVKELVELDDTSVTADIIAEDAGVIGNLDVTDELNFVNAQENVEQTTTVNGITVIAIDGESTEDYRQRVINSFQATPANGTYVDYRIWGEGVDGIAAVYPYTGNIPGQVDVYVRSATEPFGVPTAAQLDAVFQAIELDENGLATRRPANDFVNVVSIIPRDFDVEVSTLTVPVGVNLQEVKDSITLDLTNFFESRAPFINGLDFPPKVNRIAKNEILCIVDEVVNAVGGDFVDVTVNLDAAPVASYELGIGEITKFLGVTFT